MKRLPVFLALFAATAVLLIGPVPFARAQTSTMSLAPASEDALKSTYQTGKSYTLRMRYTDSAGDRIASAEFVDNSPAGRVAHQGRVGEGSPKTGVTIEWTINGFTGGAHQAYFVVKTRTQREARYPLADNQFYTFVVEDVTTKWITMGAGLLVGLLFVPFLVYLLTRSLNKRSDPSRAARIGLIVGVLACLALFIYLFLNIYDPLIHIIVGIGLLAVLVVVLARR